MNRTATALFAAVLGVAISLRLFVGFSYPNILWPDEIFQTLEQAHRLAFGYGIVPWEFRAGTRSWLLPGVLAGIMRIAGELGTGSGPYLAAVTIAFCTLSLLPVAVALLWGHRVGGTTTALVTGVLAAVWFELAYFAPKALFEAVACHLLLPALYFAHFHDQKRGRLVLSGLLLGASLALRIQLAPAVLCALVLVCRADIKGKWLPLAGSAAAAFSFGGLLDMVTWSYPFQSAWYGFALNIIEGKSLLWGTHPWYYYPVTAARVWSWAGVPLFALLLLGARNCRLLLLVALVVWITHSMVAHKEYRFVYPALPMLLIVAGCGLGALIQRLERVVAWQGLRRTALAAVVLACCLTSLWLALRFDNTRTGVNLLTEGPSHWHYFRAPLRFFQALSRDEAACGLGLRHLHWALTGGYAHLHRDIPLYDVASARKLQQLSHGFNYLLVGGVNSPRIEGYARLRCLDTYCLYKRPGSCAPRPGYHLNRLLVERGE